MKIYIKRFIALLLTGAMLLSLASCTSSQSRKRDSSCLNISIASEPRHLDPALTLNISDATLALNSFEGLYRYDENGDLEPACAISCELSEDGKTYTFTMREGLKWSNGDSLDARDFVYSWKRLADPETAAGYGYLCEIFGDAYDPDRGLSDDAVVASEDGKTLTVTLDTVCPYFLELTAFPVFYPVYQKSVEETASQTEPAGTWSQEAGDSFVCNGAYQPKKWKHDFSLVYSKNPNYWDAENVSIDTLNFMLTENTVSSYTAYESGDLDFCYNVPTDDIQAVSNTEEFHTVDCLGTMFLVFNYNSSIYGRLGLDEEEAKVFRHAINLLIDRQYIADALGQTGQQAADTLIPRAASDGNDGIFEDGFEGYYDAEDYEGNVEQAKELLASIGLWDQKKGKLTRKVSFSFMTMNSEMRRKLAEAIQGDLAEIGIDLVIDTQEYNVFLDYMKKGRYDFAFWSWTMDYNDPINMLETCESKSGNNVMHLGQDASAQLDWTQYDKLISRIRRTADTAERSDLMHQAEDMIMDTWCAVPIYYHNDYYMLKDYVKGVQINPVGIICFYHASVELE